MDDLTPDIVQNATNSINAEMKELTSTKARQNVISSFGTNADEFAEAKQIGIKTGTPPQIVNADMAAFRLRAAVDDYTPKLKQHPSFEEWLSNPDNARMAHDDVGFLTQTLDFTRSLFGTGLTSQFLGQGIQGIGSTAKSAFGVLAAEQKKNPAFGMMQDFQGLKLMTALVGMTAPTIGGGLRVAGDSIAPPVERQGFHTDVGAALGQITGGVAATILSGGTAAPTMALYFGQSAQAQTDEMDRLGVTDPYKRLLVQTAAGAATAATEKIQLGLIMKGGGKFVDALTEMPLMGNIFKGLPPSLQKKWITMPFDVAGAAAGEAAQETLDNFIQDSIAYAAFNPDVEFFKEWQDVAKTSGTAGAIARTLVMAATGLRRGGGAVHSEAETEAMKEQILQAKKMVQESKLNNRSPDSIREILEGANPENKKVTLDGSVVQAFYQSGIDPEELFSVMPEARAQFEEADLSGADVQISMHEFLAAIANAPTPDSLDFMTDFIKADEQIDPHLQGWDLEDPEQRNAFLQEAIDQAREGFDARYEKQQEGALDVQIERQIRDMLMNQDVMGLNVRTPQVAATEASLFGAFAKSMIDRSGGSDAALRVLSKRFGEAFSIIGAPPQLVRPSGTGSAYYDKLRTKVKAQEAARNKEPKRDMFGIAKPKREKGTPTPLINALSDLGGVERGSPIAKELEAIGLSPKKYPKLFRAKNTNIFSKKARPMGSLDGIPVQEFEERLGMSGIFSRDSEFNGYVSENELLEKLRNESFGKPIMTDEQAIKNQIDDNDDQVLDVLDRQGVDILTASAEDIDAALKAYTDSYLTPEGGQTYNQSERGQIQFTDEKTIIKLFEGADQSTLLHESGHLFLDVFSEIAQQPDAPAQIKEDYAKAMEWLGVASYADVKTEQHEQFARGFEAYLFKGDAPSAALKRIFSNFKLWLSTVYQSVKQLKVNVSPEMTAVFDRMLATNDEIDALRSNPILATNEATLEMLSPAQRADYLKRKEQAIQEAKDKLFRKAYRQVMRQKTEFWTEESAAVQAQVEKDLMELPAYRIMLPLQEGTDKINLAAAIKAFDGSNTVDPLGKYEVKYLPRGTTAKDGNIDPQDLADLHGYKSAVQMLTDLKNTEPYKKAVQRMTTERMIHKYGDMLNDGTIEQEALAMVMAEDTKAAEVELKALTERTGVAYPTDGDFARAAKIAIGDQKVDHAVSPDKFYRAALRAAREYGKALQAKQYDDRTSKDKDGKTTIVKGAASWKRQEIINKHLYKEARQAKQETEKALEHFNKLQKRPPKGNAKAVKIDPDYHQKIWDLLVKYNFNPRISQAKELKLQLAALNQWMKDKEQNEDAVLMMPPELAEADAKTHYRDLTMNEFRAFRDLIANLETQGRNKRKYITQNDAKDLSDLVNEMLNTADKHNDLRVVPLSERIEERSPLYKARQIINSIDAVNTKAAQMFARLDGGDNLGVWTQTIYEPMQRAEIQKNVRSRVEYKNMKALFDKWYGDESGWQDASFMVGGEKVSREMLLSIAMHQGTEDNKVKLLEGYKKARGWDDEFVDRALTNMRTKDWLFVQDVWNYLDSFWPETSAIEKRRFGYAPEKLEAQPLEVVTAEGEVLNLKGGYMRIKYDGAQAVAAENNDLAQTFKEMQTGRNARPATKRGSQIERVSGVKLPIRLDLDVLSEHVSEQVGIITMSETVENIVKVMRNADIQQTMKNYLGTDAKQMLDLWLQDVVAGGQLAGGTINSMLRSIRSNYTVGRLGLKPVTALLQFSGLSHTVADMGAKQTFKGIAQIFAKGNPYQMAEDVAAKSPFMAERRFTLNRDVSDALGAYTDKASNVQQKVSALLLLPMQKTQELVDTATWLAAYDKATKTDMLEEQQAIRAADIAVARLQSSGLVSDLAAIERGTLNNSTQRQEWVKASTMFFSYFNAKYNLVKNMQIKFENKQISAVDLAATYAMTFFVEGVISAAIMGQLDWDNDDDDELSAMELVLGVGKQTLGTAASSIPFVRQIAGAMQGFGNQTAAEGQIEGIGEFIGKTGRLVWGAGEELFTGESSSLESMNFYSYARQAIDVINTVFPVPASVINQILRAMEKDATTGDAEFMDYLVYQPD